MEYLNKDFSGMALAAATILNELGIGSELISVIMNGVKDLTTQEDLALRFIRSRLRRLEDETFKTQ